MSSILMIVTGAKELRLTDGTEHPTGFWAEELVTAHRELVRAGHSITIATPGGVTPVVDAVSLDPERVGRETAEELSAYLEEIRWELESAIPLEAVVEEYDAIVLPGGHGPMTDLAFDKEVGRLLIEANEAGKVIAPFCRGPAALLAAKGDDGANAFAGRRVTAFTDEEELSGGTGEKTPWFVETELREAGLLVEAGPAWSDHVVVDGNLITGQNPQSSASVAKEVITALGA
jgi:putative intracellular protease/amidase